MKIDRGLKTHEVIGIIVVLCIVGLIDYGAYLMHQECDAIGGVMVRGICFDPAAIRVRQ